MKLLFGLLLLMCVVGCTEPNDPAVMAENKTRLAGPGIEVGTLPDGRKIVRYQINMGSGTSDHWIYVTTGSITINREEQHDDSRETHVEVIIDGVHYTPAR